MPNKYNKAYIAKIAENFYNVRTKVFKMTQERFAQLLGFNTRIQISHYETGRFRPSAQTCNKIITEAAKLGAVVTLEYLRPDFFNK